MCYLWNSLIFFYATHLWPAEILTTLVLRVHLWYIDYIIIEMGFLQGTSVSIPIKSWQNIYTKMTH